jgi:hypothetical protein
MKLNRDRRHGGAGGANVEAGCGRASRGVSKTPCQTPHDPRCKHNLLTGAKRRCINDRLWGQNKAMNVALYGRVSTQDKGQDTKTSIPKLQPW